MAVEIRFNANFMTENRRVEYHPSDIQHADVISTAYIRQNPWKKQDRKTDCINTGLLSLPHAHDITCVEGFRLDGTIPEGPPRQVADLPLGTIAYIPNGRNGVLVRITSEVKAGIFPSLCIVRQARNCGHTYTRASEECQECSISVISVENYPSMEALGQGHLIEPFYTLYRECEPVAFVKIPTGDLRHFAGMNAVGKTTNFWRRVELPLVDYYEDAI